ncbi:MAG: hypothetical protein ACI9XO_002679 [Paraglaciecola sp.]|jgi:hypothetical protein
MCIKRKVWRSFQLYFCTPIQVFLWEFECEIWDTSPNFTLKSTHSAAEGGEEGSLRDIKIGIFWKKSNFYIL